jgi:site-specific recombinase XerD
VDEAARNGSVTNVRFSYDDAPLKYRVPECYRQFLDSYIERRRQDGNQSSTLRMDSTACTRFLLFLQSKNITNVAFITPEIVKDYHTQAEHRTADGKNAYTCRIRGFVRFLAMKKLVPETLEFAFATEKASRVSIVTTLSEEQVDTIRTLSEKSRTPSELRSVAMTILALRVGLRSVDICNLCLSDVSWRSRTISIIQQKTGAPLTLPFPVEVGNILARYILEGRPKCNEPNVFITLKHPYTRLGSSGCYASSLAVLGRKKAATDVRGLHVVRRTFASNLLAAGNLVSTISATLGHAGESRVDEYLATDDQRMRLCSIGLAGIEVKEALR